MKTSRILTETACCIFTSSIMGVLCVHASDFPSGITFGTGSEREIHPFASIGSRNSMAIGAGNGAMWLWSGVSETTDWYEDGGLFMAGEPIRMYLGALNQMYGWDQGRFEIWRGLHWGGGGNPLFAIDSTEDTASFNDLDVSINNGSFSVSGSIVLTESTASIFLPSQGFVTAQNISATIKQIPNLINGPYSNATGSHSVALGRTAIASGKFAFASGYSATATGDHSFAHGFQSNALAHNAFAGTWSTASGQGSTALSRSTASGDYAVALGRQSLASGYNAVALSRATASGQWSVAAGRYANASSYGSISLGSYNTTFGNPDSWVDTDPLLLVGNGESDINTSNAIATLKNGSTTITNKYWKSQVTANPSTALDDPPSLSDSGGNALIVDGHTILNGKVIISVPQGDISMGIYE